VAAVGGYERPGYAEAGAAPKKRHAQSAEGEKNGAKDDPRRIETERWLDATLKAFKGGTAAQALRDMLDRVERRGPVEQTRLAAGLAHRLGSHEDAQVRRVCARVLALFDEDAAQPLVRALKTDPDRGVRREAARALGYAGGEEHLPHLYRAIKKDISPIGQLGVVGAEAISAIGKIGGPRAAELLIELWEEAPLSQDDRISVLVALGAAGDPAALEILEGAIAPGQKGRFVRSTSAYALARIGVANRTNQEVAARVRSLLRKYIADRDPRVREYAVAGLGPVGSKGDIGALMVIAKTDAYRDAHLRQEDGRLLKTPFYPVREAAARAIGKIKERLTDQQ
jgi:HEAT repeat protein